MAEVNTTAPSSPSDYQLEVLMLAAGASRRFQGVKQLALVANTPLVTHSCRQLLNLVTPEQLLVLLGANHESIQAVLPQNCRHHVVTNWQQGMGQTLATGMGLIKPHTTHVLLALGDQVALTSSHYQHLVTQSQQRPEAIICASYRQTLGVPAIFPKVYFPALGALTGDQGAKSILQAHSEHLFSVAIPEAATDIDTQQQWHDWLKSPNSHPTETIDHDKV